MDSVTRAALRAAMKAAPAAESVASVAKPISPLATAETRRNPPFVASVAMLPANESDPATMPPEILPGWAEPDLTTDPTREFRDDVASDDPVSLATLATWQQTAEISHPELLPGENPAGNAGNKPHDWDTLPALAALETPELIGRAELLYGGKIGLKASGPVWNGPAELPAEVLAVLKARRLDVQAVLLARAHAAKTMTREPDSWGATDWLAYFHERAGILEHDGGMARATADAMARAECAEHWLRRNSPAPGGQENGCWQCHKAGTDPDGAWPMTTRLCRGGVFWLHPQCEGDYEAAAKAAAKAAIEPILGSGA